MLDSTSIAQQADSRGTGSKDSLSTTMMTSSSGKLCDPAENEDRKMNRIIWISRISFIVCLLTTAALLSFGAHRLLKKSEESLAEEHFDGIGERALDEALKITLRKRLGAKSLAAVASYLFPDASQWPNVTMFGFEGIAGSVLDTVSAVSMGLCPIVYPSQLEEFEDFAYNTAFAHINSHYPNTTGTKDHGTGPEKGVWGYDQSFETFRRVDGATNYNSSHNILTPFIMHSAGPPLLMFDLHSMERFGTIIDELLDCVAQSDDPADPESSDPMDNTYLNKCAILSDMIVMYDADGNESGPSAYIMQPIYPAKDRSTLTGFITSSIKWQEVLEQLFPTDVSGVDCVLETESFVYTYAINNGMALLKGQVVFTMTPSITMPMSIELGGDLFSHTSARYSLTIYPNGDLFEVFGTPKSNKRPRRGASALCYWTSILFVVYDHFARRELLRRK